MLSLAVIYAVIVLVTHGISNTLTKGVTDAFGPVRGLVLRNLVVVPALFIALLILWPSIDFTHGSILFAVLLAIAGYFPFMFFVYGLQYGKVGVVVPVSTISIIVSAFLGFFFLGETFTGIKFVAIVTIFVGVLLASVDYSLLSIKIFFDRNSGVFYALLAGILWGVLLPLFRFPSEWYGATFYALVIEVFVLVCGCIHLYIQGVSILPKTALEFSVIKNNAWSLVIAGITAALATVYYNLGFQTGEISIVAAIGGAAVAVSVLLARVLYKEMLSMSQYIGVVLVTLGVVISAF